MATPSTLSEPALQVLAWLLDLAAQRAGYTVWGQSGWASANEIEEGARTWGTAELMRAQAKRERVAEYDGRAPGETRSRWVYRITQHGMDALAPALGIAGAGVGDPLPREECRILLRETTQNAISGLRAALDPTAKPRREWFSGQVGWRSSRELTAEMARAHEAAGAPCGWFTSEDMRWLVRLGFVEEKVVGRTHVYRLLATGAALNPLEWRAPQNG